MAENIANTDITLGHDVDSADLSIISLPSTVLKSNGAFVYRGSITVMVSNAISGTCLSGVGTVTINPLATKVTSEMMPVLRKNDSGSGNVVGVEGMNACNYTITVTVDDAGQAKADAV